MIFVFFHHFHSFSINILSLHEFTMLKNQTTWSTTCHCRLWGTTKAATGPQKESPAPGSESPTAGKFRNVRRLGEQTCLTMALIAVKNWTLHYNIILYIYIRICYIYLIYYSEVFWKVSEVASRSGEASSHSPHSNPLASSPVDSELCAFKRSAWPKPRWNGKMM